MPDYIVTVEYEHVEKTREFLIVRNASSPEIAKRAAEENFRVVPFDRAALHVVLSQDVRGLKATDVKVSP
jgi:hypothetical protein